MEKKPGELSELFTGDFQRTYNTFFHDPSIIVIMSPPGPVTIKRKAEHRPSPPPLPALYNPRSPTPPPRPQRGTRFLLVFSWREERGLFFISHQRFFCLAQR